jgi:hypothetical protein
VILNHVNTSNSANDSSSLTFDANELLANAFQDV